MRWRPLTAALGLTLCLTPGPAAAEADLWTWMAQQMPLTSLRHTRIDEWEARYRARATELEITLERGQVFLPPLAQAVADRHLPMELALLPVIESQLDPSAVSPRGARGLWQILPSTAEHLGLRHTWWLDESADIVASTRAALRYLDYLHSRFGAWTLALAAYNAGEGRVSQTMRKHRQAGLSTDYWNLDLPEQARDYVPKLLALARIVRDPQGIRLPPLTREPGLLRVETGGPYPLPLLAEHAGVSLGELYRYNPQLLRWAIPAQGPYSIYLAPAAARRLQSALADLPATFQRRWQRHEVQPGENLGQIAQRHGSTVERLREINGLDSNLLRPGQVLLVASGQAPVARNILSAAQRGERLPHLPPPVEEGMHEVAAGDSLWTIARRHGTSVAALRHLNRLDGDIHVFPGQLIKVGDTDGRQRIFYRVKSGDMLSRIAERYGVSVRQIQRWNDLESSLLHPGQVLELRLNRHQRAAAG